jgi:hypothetical protein
VVILNLQCKQGVANAVGISSYYLLYLLTMHRGHSTSPQCHSHVTKLEINERYLTDSTFSLTTTTMSSKQQVHPLLDKLAPTLSLPNADGSTYELKPGQGKPMAIFFYPKAGTFPWYPIHSLYVSRNLNVDKAPLAVQEKFAVSGMRSMVCHTLSVSPKGIKNVWDQLGYRKS